MIRGLIIWGIWIAVASALAAPQPVFGAPDSSAIPGEATEPTETPADPVILEPIRPLFPEGGDNVVRPRDCGSPELLMMSAGAWFLLTLNLTPYRRWARREP